MRITLRTYALTSVACLLLAGAGMAAAQGPAAAAADCSAATTQLQLSVCAHDEFLASQAAMAEQLRLLQVDYSADQRLALRRVQRAWLRYRTEACNFESSAAAGGSSQQMVRWSCAARLTHSRTVALAQMAACVEGDLACVRPASNKPVR